MRSLLPFCLCLLSAAHISTSSYQPQIEEALAAGKTLDLPTWENGISAYWDEILQFKTHKAVVAAFVAYESERCLALRRPWLMAAQKGGGDVLFVKIDVTVPDFQMGYLVKKFHFKHPPFVFVVRKGEEKEIPFKEALTEENLVALVGRLRKGEPVVQEAQAQAEKKKLEEISRQPEEPVATVVEKKGEL